MNRFSQRDNYWMQEAHAQFSAASSNFKSRLKQIFGGVWKDVRPVSDGDILMESFISTRNYSSEGRTYYLKFLMYIKFDFGRDTYEVKSVIFSEKLLKTVIIEDWKNDIYVEQMLDPSIWIEQKPELIGL